jgi:hypothetical protein
MRICLLLAAFLVAAAGCGQGGVAPVSGKVMLDGNPLPGVLLSYEPESSGGQDAGGGSYATTDAAGAYTLHLVNGDKPGAVVGKHRVKIAAPVDASSDRDLGGKAPQPKVVLPARYNTSTELTMEVPPGGRSDANFDLKSR